MGCNEILAGRKCIGYLLCMFLRIVSSYQWLLKDKYLAIVAQPSSFISLSNT